VLILADSDVLIDALRGRPLAWARVATGLATGTLVISGVTLLELLDGTTAEEDRERVETLLAALPVLPFDRAAAEAAETVRRSLREEGREIGLAESQIAGLCLSRDATLLTGNAAPFEPLAGLRIEVLPAS